MFFCAAAFLILLVSGCEARGVNGGLSCAACTIVFGLADQLAEIHNESLLAGSLRVCDMLPSPGNDYCRDIVKLVWPLLVNREVSKYFTPDVFCYGIDVCYTEENTGFCHLFPRPLSNFRNTVHQIKKVTAQNGRGKEYQQHLERLGIALCHIPGIKQICDMFNKTWMKTEPAIDLDGDRFSIVNTARGYHWRGRDCEDWNPLAYPGREPENGDTAADYNCNGIWGIDQKSGKPYEDEFCKETGSRGLIIIGDSVSAHFHFPEAWMNPLLISNYVLHNYTEHLLDELDWPHLGYATGFTNTTEPLLIKGRTDSIYLRLRDRNLCNHRDYQNICRNGDSSFDAVKRVKSIARNKNRDKPALVIYGLFGNDVCNNHADTISNMTTPEEYRKNVMEVLSALDTMLPKGSHVLLIGLVDGSFIYPEMANRFHPLGKFRRDIRYRDVYKWFTCMEIGPCVGWMTSNETLRQITSQRAQELSDVLENIAKEQKFSSFEVFYLENPIHQVFKEWTEKGNQVWQLLDPVDSFHPNQIAQPLIAENLWRDISKKFPQALGETNPHNERIRKIFGDQNGH
ncbi:acyloxyacyl hydrolase-like [Schistocerca cancellata]|uniref:acyloxyacyl hydrolase-like n=1 Tax=Schistocerca cancellata TaxID=274614 RepID=UPI002118A76A|nr:acyloxyacyl hydrolase-like [Schistocerca cancellata]